MSHNQNYKKFVVMRMYFQRKLSLTSIFSLILSLTIVAQSKKELSQQIQELREDYKKLESEIIELKKQFSQNTATLKEILSSNSNFSEQLYELKQNLDNFKKLTDSTIFNLASNNIAEPKHSMTSDASSNSYVSENEAIYSTILNFLNSKNLEGKLKCVLYPEYVQQFMKSYYENNPPTSNVTKKDISIQGNSFKNGEVFKVFVKRIDEFFGSYNEIIYVKKIDNSFKIDWMATTGTNEISFVELFNNGYNKPSKFRVIAKLLQPNMFFKNTYYEIVLNEASMTNTILGGILKNSPEGKRLYNILKDGRDHRLILELEYTSQNGDMDVMVNKLVKDGWSDE